MGTQVERRREKRLRFFWPLWFGYQESGELIRGQAVDLNRTGISFTVEERLCPSPGQRVVTRFSFPRHAQDDFAMDSYYHWSEVIRVDRAVGGRCRVALRLHQPLAYNPAEPVEEQALAQTA